MSRKYLNPSFVFDAPEDKEGVAITCYYHEYWICPNPENEALVKSFQESPVHLYETKIKYISRKNFEKKEAWNP